MASAGWTAILEPSRNSEEWQCWESVPIKGACGKRTGCIWTTWARTPSILDALSQDAELPFGHPGRRSDDTPEGFEPSPLVDQGPERDCMPDEDDAIVHYAPGEHPLCGTESMTAVYTDNPAISGPPQPGCLELG